MVPVQTRARKHSWLLQSAAACSRRPALSGLVDERVRIKDAPNSGGANAGATVLTIIAGIICGADSFDDLARLSHGAMGKVFTGGRAVSTCGTLLRSFTHGHVKNNRMRSCGLCWPRWSPAPVICSRTPT
ncbi:hypothetical protein GCM10022223_33020 [Kineosporia mesophila]|uniref:Uncharacterized protein n=1 Tax=Kineosporia mesophila TaxID=566012 RepID=A0ABP6ZMP3_9ACTN